MIFRPGEIVQLKSGGPKMTVEESHPDQTRCVWFKDDERKGSWFNNDLLTAVPPETIKRIIADL
jgi:uncharacterized protein YodC (DUF2158 family)